MGHTGTKLKQDRGFPGLRIETGGTQHFWFDLLFPIREKSHLFRIP
jgi:hypothetical protein